MLILIASCNNHEERLVVDGPKAPPIAVTDWITQPLTGDDPFHDKIVVLEFWATWCGSCIAQIPHLNKLAEKHAGEDVIFVSISDEKRHVLEKFVQRKEMKTRVATDTTAEVKRAYDVFGIPKTVLIDKNGVMRWSGHANQLTDQMLSEFIRTGRLPERIAPSSTREISAQAGSAEYEFSIEPTASTGGSYNYLGMTPDNGIEITFINYTVPQIVRSLKRLSMTRLTVMGRDTFPRVDVTLRSSTSTDAVEAQQEMLFRLETELGFRMRQEINRLQAWAISCPDAGRLITSAEGASYYGTQDGQWTGTNQTLSGLAAALEEVFGIVAVDHSGLNGLYDFDFPASDLQTALAFLKTKYGVEATQQQETIEVTVLDFGSQ